MAADRHDPTLMQYALDGSEPYSFRKDPSVPNFPDERPLIVFDGVCVLCSRFARFVMARDREEEFLFTHAQSKLGQALFNHYGLNTFEFETNLLVENGLAFGHLESAALITQRFGWPWSMAMGLLKLPRPLGLRIYNRIARNRYAMFGRHNTCWIPDGRLRERLLP